MKSILLHQIFNSEKHIIKNKLGELITNIKLMKFNMKQLYKTILLIATGVFCFTQTGNAQKDTTELKIGKKKLIIVEEKTQKENAIYNLEKAKESFEKEIAQAEKHAKQREELMKQQRELLILKEELIKQREELIKEKEKLFDSSLISKLDSEDFLLSDSANLSEKELSESLKNEIKKDITFNESNENELDKLIQEKIKLLLYKNEAEKLKAEIEKGKLLVELNRKKQQAFKDGIAGIDNGIKDIKSGMAELNKELNSEKNVNYHKGFKISNLNHPSFNSHWAGFEFGILNFLNTKRTLATNQELDYLVLIPEKTMSYGLNILEYDIVLSKNHRFGAATGTGLEWNSIALKQNINLYEDENGIIRAEYVDPNVTDYTKNKLNTVYVTVPVILEFQIPIKHRKFFIGAGITGGIRAWSKQKQKYKVDGQRYKNKKTDNFQLAAFRYGATARIGYGDVGFFINYSFVPLFKEGAGPELFPISVGLKIVDF